MPLAIEASGLTRTYRASGRHPAVRAVDGVDLQVKQGEVMALLGPNGAGKTTIVRLLACLLRPTQGTARVAGYDVREHPGKVRAACGVGTEAGSLYEQFTARQYLAFFARLYSIPEAQVAARVEEQLRAAALWERRDDRLGAFSKGMRQKINIARALIHRPRVVFLDEPTSGLDVEAAGALREHLQTMNRDADTTFLLCTHNLPEAERLCSRIAVMNRGRILAAGSPEELKHQLFGGRVFRARLRRGLPQHRDAAAATPGVEHVELDGNLLAIRIAGDEAEVNPLIVRRLVESGAEVISFSSEGRSLEDVYLHLVHQAGEAPA
jgi:ABC-2 type transport system ATP-binding protein